MWKRSPAEPTAVAGIRDGPSQAPGDGAPGGGVGRVLVELEVEGVGPRRPATHEPDGGPVQHPGQVVGGRSAVVLDTAVHRQVVAVVALRLELGHPAVPSGRHVRGLGEGPLERVQVLADVGGDVSGALKPGGEDVVLVLQRVVGVLEDAVVVPVLAGEGGGSRRAAERRRDDEIGEGGAAVGQQPHRLGHRSPAQLGQGLVVGPDEDDVRPIRAGAFGKRGGGGLRSPMLGRPSAPGRDDRQGGDGCQARAHGRRRIDARAQGLCPSRRPAR